MKQIILITDGCSNVGLDPIIAAAEAKAQEIVVHVIGVIDQGEIGEMGAEEIRKIARAGGGLSRIVSSELLSETVQMMTRKTVTNTIQEAVNKELQQIFGARDVQDLPPETRGQVVQAMEELSESSELRIALLVDSSASMKPKLHAVQEAVHDLMLSLRAREGISEIAVFHFPAESGEGAHLDLPWTRELAKVPNLFYKINMKGTTPTGPALLRTISYFEPAVSRRQKDGILSDYVV